MEDYQSKKWLIHVWTVCALGLFIDGYDLYISSVAEPFINVLYHPTPLMTGLTQAAAPMGAALGALTIGRMSDMVGRKSLLIFNLIFFVIIALLSACAWNTISLCVLRFLIGFGVGADYPICAAYLAEMTPKHQTSKFITAAMFINCLASPVGVFVAWVMFKLYPHIDVWRLMFASGAVPAVIGLLLRAKLPESFAWKVSQRLKKNNSIMHNYKKLFSPDLLKITLCMSFSWFLLDISYYGIGLFTPYVLQAVHISSHADFLSSASDVLKSTLFVNIFVVLGAFSIIFCVKKLDRIKLQKIGFIYSFLGLLILSLSQTTSSSINLSMIFTGFILFNFFVNFGPGITTYLLPAELYTTDIKATGHGFAAGCGKFGAFIGTIFMPILQVNVGIYVTVGLLSTTLLLGWMLTYILGKQDLGLDFQNALSVGV
jgi:putative MFS transporter